MPSQLHKGFVLAALLMLAGAGSAAAVPPTPLTLWGTVQVDGDNVPLDTVVVAWCGGVQASAPAQLWLDGAGRSAYALTVVGDEPDTPQKDGCVASETVSFQVSALWATQTLPWQSTGQLLNLTAWTTAQPAAITDVRASVIPTDVLRLQWTAVTTDVFGVHISGVKYDVCWAMDNPYFTVSPLCSEGLADPWFTQTGVVGNTEHSYAYLVTPVDGIGRKGQPSNRVGAFAFVLTKGN